MIELLVDGAVRAAVHGDAESFTESVLALTDLPGRAGPTLPARLVDRALTGAMNSGVTLGWRRGWQPADLVRYVGREHGKHAQRMMTDAVAAEMRAYSSATVDERWLDQMSVLDATVWWDRDDTYLSDWAARQGTDRATTITCALHVIALLRTLPQLERLCPPPGEARRTASSTRTATAADQRMLDKIRALLAKAESTDFPEEAEALTARAQQLMARYSIDHALLAARSGGEQEGPGGRRLPIDNPYESPKAVLLANIAQANRCRAVWTKRLGFSTVLGFPADLDAVELLFTSLLVQANTALVREGGKRGPGGRSRTRSFRHSFLSSYALRIGERLTKATGDVERQAAAEAPGTGLLPVLAARDRAVDDALGSMFPELTEHRMTGITDREGWMSGRAAADRADLHGHTPAIGSEG
ncbi:DUF2786 domain-containing protein [Actinomadura alba]|uniref:DUF2786 domain-containing protein n=1 Tax=Actinomadura alba TaxID=406431 RepID=UPI0031DFC0F0